MRYALLPLLLTLTLVGCTSSGGESAAVDELDRWTFPDDAAGFTQLSFELDRDTRTVIVSYKLAEPNILVTVYVYPAETIVSIASNQEVREAAARLLTEREFEASQRALVSSNPGVQLLWEDRDANIEISGQMRTGFGAGYGFLGALPGGEPEPIGTYLFLYRYQDWSVKYRFTFALDEEDGNAALVLNLIQAIPWPE